MNPQPCLRLWLRGRSGESEEGLRRDDLLHPQPQRKVTGNASVSTVLFPHTDKGRIVAEAYSLLPGDLRDTKACQAALEAADFDPACPTYVLAECVLVYMEPEDSASVVRWLGQWLRTAAFVVYEQVRASGLRCKESVQYVHFSPPLASGESVPMASHVYSETEAPLLRAKRAVSQKAFIHAV